jgi:hypothetical protein
MQTAANTHKNVEQNCEVTFSKDFGISRRKPSGGIINSSINNNERDHYGRTE